MSYGYGYGYNLSFLKKEDINRTNLGSMVFDTESYYLQSSGFDFSNISGSNQWSFSIGFSPSSDLPYTDLDLIGQWNTASNQRAWLMRVRSDRRLELFLSNTGNTADVRIVSVNAITDDYNQVVFTFDPTQGTITDAIKIYVNGSPDTYTITNDSGDYEMNAVSTVGLTLGCFFISGTPTNYFQGWVNNLEIHTATLTSTEVSDAYNSGSPISTNDRADCIFSLNIDGATESSGVYTVPESINGHNMVQTSASSAGDRTSHFCPRLNPYGIDTSTPDFTLADNTGFYEFDNQVGASFTFNGSLQFDLLHTGTSDPDRNSCETVSKEAYYIGDGTPLWVRFDNFTWDTSIDSMAHGGFSLVDLRSDLRWTMITFAVRTDLGKLGNYRVIYSTSASQPDFESTIPKGKDVFLKIEGTTISYWYNNSGVLTQIWTDQTNDMGDWIRIKAHTRDENVYAAPDQFTVDNIKVYRTTPTDL